MTLTNSVLCPLFITSDRKRALEYLLINNPMWVGFLSSGSIWSIFQCFVEQVHVTVCLVHQLFNTGNMLLCSLLKLWKRVIEVTHSFVSCSLQTPRAHPFHSMTLQTASILFTIRPRKKPQCTKRVSLNKIINSHLAMFQPRQPRQSRKQSQPWDMNSSYAKRQRMSQKR